MKRIMLAISAILFSAFAASAQAPEVIQTAPAQNENSASLSSNIYVKFNVDIDPASINDTTFSVYSRTYGFLSGVISYDQPTTTATFNPARDFFHGDVITATLTNGINSLGGTPMERGFSWTFTVIAGGTGAFGAFDEYPVHGRPNSVFIADLDMDDYPDIITGQISVFLNSGSGTFPIRTDYILTDILNSINAADFDKDGDIDICALRAGTAAYEMIIMLNNGDGTFVFSAAFVIGYDLRDVCAVDIDCDVDLDIVFVGTDSLNNDQIFIFTNDGLGNFNFDSSFPLLNIARAVYAGDFNNDGATDIAATCNGLALLYNNGYGVFSTPLYFPFSSGTYGVTGADLNSDGLLDLAVSTFSGRTLWILINEGNGNFNPLFNYLTDSRLFNLCAADLNGNQSTDISVVSLHYYSYNNTHIFYNRGNGAMNLYSSFNISNSSRIYESFSSDLDLDGDMDIVTANHNSYSITVMKNLPVCGYVTGDVNDDGGYNGIDVVYAVNYFKGGDPPVYDECDCPVGGFWYVAGDVNASCDFNGLDITYGVSYFKGGPDPMPCPECPPAQ